MNLEKESIIFLYTIFLLRKFYFLFKNIKFFEPNYSVTKIDFMNKWKKYVNFSIIFDLIEIIQITFGFFLKIKNFSSNYFLKNIILFITKEFQSLISLLINLLAFLKYISVFYNFKNDKEKKIFNNFFIFCLEALENNRRAYDIFINEVKNNDFLILDYFSIKKDLKKKFNDYEKKIFKRKLEEEEFLTKEELIKEEKTDLRQKEQFSITLFLRVHMNFVLRMPDVFYKNVKEKIIYPNYNQKFLKKNINDLLNDFILNLDYCNFFDIYIYRNLPNIPILNKNEIYLKKRKLEKNLKPKDILFEEKEDIYKKIKTQNAGVQENGLKNDYEKLEEDIKWLKNENFILENKLLEKKEKEKKEKNNLEKKEENNLEKKEEISSDIFISEKDEEKLTKNILKKFILFEFRRNIEEWIISYKDLKIEKLIANGSSSQIFKGKYKGITVAIKKLKKPKKEEDKKFLKEFKREISVLVSLPAHPNIINILGLSINKNDIYLITEFCEGGTVFEILHEYKKKLN